jgi:hypothetical protein
MRDQQKTRTEPIREFSPREAGLYGDKRDELIGTTTESTTPGQGIPMANERVLTRELLADFEPKRGETKTCIRNGRVGMDAGPVTFGPDTRGGFGLFSLRERLHYIGGGLRIESKSGARNEEHIDYAREGAREIYKGRPI